MELSYLAEAGPRVDHEPVLIGITADATGQCCAALHSQDVVDEGIDGIVRAIESAVKEAITILGVRHVDGDGRDVDQPVPYGLTLVGFELNGAEW